MARRRKGSTAAGKPSRPYTAKAKGGVSAGIYAAVEKLVGDNRMSRLAAFRRLASTSGRNVGAISAGYYYAAKKRGLKRRPGKIAVGARRNAQPRAQSLLTALAEVVRAQAAELETLRRNNERFVALRALIGRG